MRVLVAPDKFKGTLSAEQAARAIATGWRRERPGDELDLAPMADGGEGTLDALVAALGGEIRRLRVSGPLGDPVEAAFGLVEAAGGRTGIVELARASGLQLVAESRRDALRATTRGAGELLLAAAREGIAEALVCIGGSATTDGGAGLASALGVRFLDEAGSPIGDGGAALLSLARVDVTGLAREVRGLRVTVASDVDNPLVGPRGAAHVYSPQKGASPEQVLLLDRALAHYAAVVHRDLGIDVRNLPGAGAAGGSGAGLIAFLGAHLRPGVEVVMEALGLAARVAAADLVLTGEGRLDESSFSGKVPAGVLAEARRSNTPSAVLCGVAEVHPEGLWVGSLVEAAGEERAFGEARSSLEDLAAQAAREAESVSSPP